MASSYSFIAQPTLITYPGAERDSQRDKLSVAQDDNTTTEKSSISLAGIEETNTPWKQPRTATTTEATIKDNLMKHETAILNPEKPFGAEKNNQKVIKLSVAQDASTTIEKTKHISLADIEETNTPWKQRTATTTEATIKENMLKHKTAILASINPEKLFGLYRRYGLYDTDYRSRKEKADALFETVVKNNAFSEFLKALERGKEHMGHMYIVSLLKGTQFGTKENIDKSKVLLDRIKEKYADDAMDFLNVDALNRHLCSAELLTNEESQNFTNNKLSTQAKARLLLDILDTKGPTAYSIFVYKCLAEEKEHLAHAELYNTFTGESVEYRRRLNRKRKAPIEDICTPPTKRYPYLLENPSGLKKDKYLREIRTIRRYHLKGGTWWVIAEQIYHGIMDSVDYALEMKIAVLLESCTMHITKKDSKEVLARVEEAKIMSKRLHRQDRNVDMLEGRCEWVKAKLYRYTKELDKAEEHITAARSKLYNCEEGEETALVSYCHACILLSKPDRTSADEEQAIDDLYLAIRCARQGESEDLKQGKYGLDPTHCKIRLAQARVGSSTGSTGKAVGEVPYESVTEATWILEGINQEDLQYRQKCMYLYTCSDVCRVGGNKQEAVKCAQEAFQIAQKHNFNTEKESAKLRLERLSEAHYYTGY